MIILKKTEMKKVLIAVGVLAVAAIVLFVIPLEIVIERTAVIKADRAVVYNNVSKFEEFAKWSPWADLDTSQTVAYSGVDGTVGAKFNWESTNDEVGTGSQEIVGITADRVDMKLVFTAPWQSTADTYFVLSDKEEGVEVLWGMKTDGNLMMKFMMTGMLEECYDQGFANLKKLVE